MRVVAALPGGGFAPAVAVMPALGNGTRLVAGVDIVNGLAMPLNQTGGVLKGFPLWGHCVKVGYDVPVNQSGIVPGGGGYSCTFQATYDQTGTVLSPELTAVTSAASRTWKAAPRVALLFLMMGFMIVM
jgi:hypothetical protein